MTEQQEYALRQIYQRISMQRQNEKIYRVFTKKSTTYLPQITRAISQKRHSNTKSKSYLQYISQIAQINNVVDYSARDPRFVQNEQRKLKKVLQKINSDTLQLVNELKPKKNYDLDLSLRNKEKQVLCSDKVIINLKQEIKKLQTKMEAIIQIENSNSLKSQIAAIKANILQIKTENLGTNFGVAQTANLIVREDSFQFSQSSSPFQKLLQEQQNYNSKLLRLKNLFHKVKQQIDQALTKINTLDPIYKQIENSFVNEQKQIYLYSEITKVNKEYQHKKTTFSVLKKKKQIICNRFQYKYYNFLKRIEELQLNTINIDKKTNEIQDQLSATKQELQKLQITFTEIKRRKREVSVLTEQFLRKIHQNKMKENDINTNNQKQFQNNPQKISKKLKIDLQQFIKQQNDLNIQV